MSFGHRDEPDFDGVMRLAFCLDGDYERQVGRSPAGGHRARVTVHADGPALTGDQLETLTRQVARALSVDADGAAYAAMCEADPALSRLARVAPGFRPALFYSPYEAAVWSIISARRARPQGIAARGRLAAAYGTTFELAGKPTDTVPTPSALRALSEVPGLPRDRIPRLHAVAEAASGGLLSAGRFQDMGPEEAMAELQQLPGIGPFYVLDRRPRLRADRRASCPGGPLPGGGACAIRRGSRAVRRRVRGVRRALAAVADLGAGGYPGPDSSADKGGLT